MTTDKHGQPSAVLRGFGKRLKFLRQMKNLTQADLAARVGLSLRQLIRIEHGRSSPQFPLLDKFCEVLETSPAQLFLFQDEPANGPVAAVPEPDTIHLLSSHLTRPVLAGTWTLHPASGRMRWSPSLFTFLGFAGSSGHASLKRFLKRVHPGDAEALGRFVAEADHQDAPGKIVIRVTVRKGAERVVLITREDSGAPLGAMDAQDEGLGRVIRLTLLDVTELLRAQQLLYLHTDQVETALKDRNRKLTRTVDELEQEIAQRTRTEQALESNKAMMAEAERLAGLGSWECDIAGDQWFFSEGWRRIHGCAAPPRTEDELLTLAHPEDTQRILRAFDRAMHGGEPYDIQHRIVRRDTSEIRHIQAYGVVKSDDAGRPEKFYGACLDITERKRDEDEIRSKTDFLRIIAETSTALSGAGSSAEFGQTMDRCLQDLGRLFAVGRAYLFLFAPDLERLSLTHEWCAPGVTPQKVLNQTLRLDSFPHFRQFAGSVLHVPDVAALPPEAEEERRFLQEQDIRALLCVPANTTRGRLVGFIGFDVISGPYQWTEEQIMLLRIVADAAAGAVSRMETEIKLRQARDIVENIETGLYVYHLENPDDDRTLRLIDAYPAAESLTGIKADDVVGKTIDENFPGLRDMGVPRRFVEVVRSGRAARIGDIIYGDGRITPTTFAVNAFPLPDNHLGVAFEDVTDRKQVELQTQEAHQRLLTVMNSMDALVYIADMQTHELLFLNDFGVKIFGEAVGRKCWQVIQSDQSGPCAFCTNARLLDAQGQPTGTYTWEFQNTITQRWYECRDQAIPWTDGRFVRMETAMDITDRKEAEEKSVRFASLLSATLESTADGLLVVNSDGIRTLCNQRFIEMWRISEDILKDNVDETMLQHVLDQIENPQGFLAKVRELYNTPEESSFDILNLVDGRVFERYSQPQRQGKTIIGRVWSFRDVTQRKQVEEKLRSMSMAVEQSPASIVLTDLNGDIEYVNPAFTRVTGYSLDEVLGRNPRVLKSPDKSSEEYRELWTTITAGKEWRGEFKNIKKNGDVFWEAASISPISDDHGRTTHYVAIKEDITERKRSEQMTEIRLRLIDYSTDHSLDELMTKALDEIEGFLNSSISFLHFVEPDQQTLSLQQWSTATTERFCEAPGRGLHYAVDQAGVWADCVRERRGIIHNDYASLPNKKGLPDGHAEVIREMVVPVLRRGAVAAILGVGNKPVDYTQDDLNALTFLADVTWHLVQQKRTQEALQNSEARLKTITDAAQDAIIMMDAQGIVSYWNPAAENILGYTWDEAMGRDLHQLIMPSRYTEAFQASFPDFQKTGRGNAVGRTIELYARTKNGREIPVELALSSVFIHGQWHAIGIARDITEKKQASEELHRNAKNLEIKNAELDAARIKAEEATRAKSEFLANMSHEIRTPMNGVIGMTGLLMDTDLDDEQRHYARTVRSSAQSLLTVINDILDFSKIEAGRLDIETIDFDLEAMLRDFSGMMAVKAEEKGLELICAMDPDVPSLVRGDPGRLRQILMNLVGNAVKFTEEGEVEIRVQKEKDDAGMLAYWDAGMPDITLRFSVRDTGIGIPEDKQDRLFESFSQVDASTTRKFGGTGLGLAISRQLAELMGGEVGLDSQEGQGSTFWFTVTLELQENQHQNRLEPACLEGVRVLIVDDNPTNREILMVRLGSWEMRPEEASSGPEALRMLHKAHADNDPFVVAVLDMQMPDMDGETLGRTIKQDEHLKDTRLILMSSATGQTGDSRRLKEAGFDISLHKPVLPSALHACLEKVLTETGTADLVTEQTKQGKFPLGYPDFSGTKARILLAEDIVVNQQVALGILKKFGLHADAVANGREALHALQTIPYDLVFMDVQMPEMDGLCATREIRRRENNAGMLECWNAGIEKTEGQNGIPGQTEQSDAAPGSDSQAFQNSSIPASQNPRIPIIALTAGAMQEDRVRCFEAGMDDYVTKPINPVELVRVLERWLPEDRGQRAEIRGQEPKEESQLSEDEEQVRTGQDFPVFDRAALLNRCMGDEDLVREVLGISVENIPQRIQELQAALDVDDTQAARMAAHTIKGMTANIGAEALRELAGEMEEAARDGNLEAVGGRMDELNVLYEQLRAVIDVRHPKTDME